MPSRNPIVYIDAIQPHDRRIHLLVLYADKEARIELPATTPLSAQEPGVETHRRALQELLSALQAAVESPAGIAWPHGRPPIQV
jgi:hypothetical protein